MIERAKWISDQRPQFSTGMTIFGGQEALITFEDAQLCYIHGVFSGAIVLGQSFIEQSICGLAYSAGKFAEDDRPGYHDAVEFLDENDILASDDVEGVALNELHQRRNPIVHYRGPIDGTTFSGRKMEHIRENPETKALTIYDMLKEDAEMVLKTCFSVSRTFGVGDRIG
ncbi:hypothetical protein [Halorubrum vacuolatum]|uniref:hypothetical protein n=1 Tax=Halorubrum vacuolatum TaxID=63740 RepID=UPI00117B42CF|nr:hypothetical protein [Halorubrum vacuolatum]